MLTVVICSTVWLFRIRFLTQIIKRVCFIAMICGAEYECCLHTIYSRKKGSLCVWHAASIPLPDGSNDTYITFPNWDGLYLRKNVPYFRAERRSWPFLFLPLWQEKWKHSHRNMTCSMQSECLVIRFHWKWKWNEVGGIIVMWAHHVSPSFNPVISAPTWVGSRPSLTVLHLEEA
jgi:hypothetical protein